MASGRSAVIGVGRQTGKGVALAVPKFEHAMGGGLITPERTTEDMAWTTDTQDIPGAYVSRVSGLADLSVPLLPRSAVVWLHAVLGARTTTGAGPFDHSLSPADSLPWLTTFYDQPDDPLEANKNFLTMVDTKVGSAQLNFAPGSPLSLDLSGAGISLSRAAAKWGAAGLAEGVDPFFTYIGATMNLDVAATPAVTRLRSIRNGNVSINRNLDAIQTDGLGYQEIFEQTRQIGVSLNDVVFENNNLINTVFFGSASGLTPSGAVVYGSADFTFLLSDGTAAAVAQLKITLNRVLWTVDRVPAADPSGATLAYTVTGRVVKPAAGASITILVKNADSGANY